MGLKQIIIVRADLKMPKGKLAAQVAHGSVESVLKSNERVVKEWVKEGMKKVVLKVDNLQELKKIFIEAKKEGLIAGIINDAGRTFLRPGTATVVGIGPDNEETIDVITAHLKML